MLVVMCSEIRVVRREGVECVHVLKSWAGRRTLLSGKL